MNAEEVMKMMNAWVAKKSKDESDAYVIGYLQSLLETLANKDTLVLAALINHFGEEA